MAFPNMSVPVDHATEADRISFLRRTLTWTFGGVGIAAVTSVASAYFLAGTPMLVSGFAPMILILGMWAITNFVARPMVFGQAKAAGFILGNAAQGVAMGFLLLVALVVTRVNLGGSGFQLIGLAMGLTFFTALGMTAYVYTTRRDFSLIGAGLSALFFPMLILMGVGIAFPDAFGGGLGIALSGLFVLISAAGLLYQLNQVIHDYNTDMHIEAGYTISIAVLVLFWNILTLLLRLTSRR